MGRSNEVQEGRENSGLEIWYVDFGTSEVNKYLTRLHTFQTRVHVIQRRITLHFHEDISLDPNVLSFVNVA